MQKIHNLAPVRLGLSRSLALAVPLGLVGAGAAVAEAPRPAPDARATAIEAPEAAVESASQPDRERASRRFPREQSSREGRAFRNGRPDRRPDRRSAPAARWFGRRIANELNLTDEQRDRMRQAMRELGDNRRDSRRHIADARRSLQQAARNSERTAEEIQALGESLGRAQAEAVLRQRTDRERIAGILTEEQRATLGQLRENRDGARDQRQDQRQDRRQDRHQDRRRRRG